MVFNSYIFLVFFAAVLALHYLPLPWRVKKFNLLWASYLFYAAWNPPFIVLLWISTIADWWCAKGIFRSRSLSRKRLFLAGSLVVNLGLLGYFKYGGFVLENFVQLADALGIGFSPAAPDIVLPVGISFYTFQSLSYSLDIYRGKLEPWDSRLDFAMYVTFFPQLVAGPIVRAADFLPQLEAERRATAEQFGWGMFLVVLGLFEKIVLADAFCAPVADAVYAAPHSAGMGDAWIGTMAFSAQIFFDFNGYSTTAIGCGLCLGFLLPDNFRSPYAAAGFTDFWRRWHISLSSWLRDYLYIQLGGNRKGDLRAAVNAMITMLLGGLWHGASWRFVAWGGIHGALLMAERGVRRLLPDARLNSRAALFGMVFFTWICVLFTWTFFRAQTFGGAASLCAAMVAGGASSLVDARGAIYILVITVGLLAVHWGMRDRDFVHTMAAVPWFWRAVFVAAMLVAMGLTPGEDRAFIYFQF
ncbi:MAG: MBOAT family O-acyltransferase [Desulfatibacillaceae bacterium]